MSWNMPNGCSENDIPGFNDPDGEPCSSCHELSLTHIGCIECEQEICVCGQENYTKLTDCCNAPTESIEENREYWKWEHADSAYNKYKDEL